MTGGFTFPAWLIEEAHRLLPSHFTGKIEINCFQGSVGNVNVGFSVKAPTG